MSLRVLPLLPPNHAPPKSIPERFTIDEEENDNIYRWVKRKSVKTNG